MPVNSDASTLQISTGAQLLSLKSIIDRSSSYSVVKVHKREWVGSKVLQEQYESSSDCAMLAPKLCWICKNTRPLRAHQWCRRNVGMHCT